MARFKRPAGWRQFAHPADHVQGEFWSLRLKDGMGAMRSAWVIQVLSQLTGDQVDQLGELLSAHQGVAADWLQERFCCPRYVVRAIEAEELLDLVRADDLAAGRLDGGPTQ
jgi:hypothetical protein